MIKVLDLIGRIFISGIFLLSGFNKIGNYDGTVGWMESFGLPGFLLIPAIILEIVAPILIIIGYKKKRIKNDYRPFKRKKDELLHVNSYDNDKKNINPSLFLHKFH